MNQELGLGTSIPNILIIKLINNGEILKKLFKKNFFIITEFN